MHSPRSAEMDSGTATFKFCAKKNKKKTKRMGVYFHFFFGAKNLIEEVCFNQLQKKVL